MASVRLRFPTANSRIPTVSALLRYIYDISLNISYQWIVQLALWTVMSVFIRIKIYQPSLGMKWQAPNSAHSYRIPTFPILTWSTQSKPTSSRNLKGKQWMVKIKARIGDLRFWPRLGRPDIKHQAYPAANFVSTPPIKTQLLSAHLATRSENAFWTRACWIVNNMTQPGWPSRAEEKTVPKSRANLFIHGKIFISLFFPDSNKSSALNRLLA